MSGLPGQWLWWDNQYANQCVGASYPAYDPAKKAYDTYYANAVGWVDNHYWLFGIDTVRTPRTVTVAGPQPIYGTEPVYSYKSVYNSKTKKWTTVKTQTGTRQIITGYTPVVPVTVTVSTITDRTNSGMDNTTTRTYSTPGTYSYTRVDVTYFPNWNGRTVNYGPCYYPSAPKLITNNCPASVGPGTMTGPSGNAATSPWPVPTGPGTYDPQTEMRKWRTAPANAASNPLWVNAPNGGTLYSTIGMEWKKGATSKFFQQGNTTALALARDCTDITYNTTALGQPCQYLGTTYPDKYGKWLPATDPICQLTPGNYYKKAAGEATKCQYVQYYWDPFSQQYTSKQTFLQCEPPQACPDCAVDGWANWKCNDANGSNGRDLTYNFANCNSTTTYMCSFADSKPTIKDPAGVTKPNGAQVLANGKQWTLAWNAPSAVRSSTGGNVTPQNKWMQFLRAENSQPVRVGAGTGADTQPVFAHTTKTANPTNTSSLLTDAGSETGTDGWDKSTLYLRAYQGSKVNLTGSLLYVGRNQVANPATVNPNGLIPYGVYLAFIYTHPRTVSTGPGGTVTIDVPEVCATNMATLYMTSGRPTN